MLVQILVTQRNKYLHDQLYDYMMVKIFQRLAEILNIGVRMEKLAVKAKINEPNTVQ